MVSKKAVIIAGGKGTRIRSITKDAIPKALVEVAGRPIVFRQMDVLARYGFDQIAVIAGYLAEELKEAMIPEAEKLNVNIRFYVEDQPLGTAGGLEAVADFVKNDPFVVLYADVAVEMNLNRLVDFHLSNRSVATIVAHPNDHPFESDILKVDGENRVLKIISRQGKKDKFYHNIVPAAVYCFSEGVFDYIQPGEKQDFIREVFPRIIKARRLLCYRTCEYLKDVGTVNRHRLVEADIGTKFFFRMNSDNRRPAVFFDRDGVLNPDNGSGGITNAKQFKLYKNASQAVKAVNDSGYLAVLATNQPQIAKGFCSFDEVDNIHAKLETKLGEEGAWFDKIYLCPHHPQAGFEGEVKKLKKKCDCRKPKPGMIKKAQQQLPISLEQSCIIGDSWRDMAAGRAVNIYAYGVRTANACRDCYGQYEPDLMFSDVFEAAKFAVGGVEQAEELAKELTKELTCPNTPLVVGICGLSKAGKTTFAHALQKCLKRLNVKSIHIKLDNWILPYSVTESDGSSQQAIQTELSAEILNIRIEQNSVTAPDFNPITKQINKNVTSLLKDKSIVIMDGLFACHDTIRENLDYAVYIQAEERKIRARFFEYHRWLKTPKEKIKQIFEFQKKHQWPIIEQQKDTVGQLISV